MKKRAVKTIVASTVMAAVLSTTAAQCRATEASPYPVGPDGKITKRELVKEPINVRDYFLTVRSQDGRDKVTRFEANQADYNACQVGDDYPSCAGR